MSVEDNVASARRIFEAFNTGDQGILDEVCAPEIVSHDPAEEDDLRGVEAHKERIQGYRTAMSDLHVTCEEAFGSSEFVATRWTARGTNDGELSGMPATGNRMEITGLTIDRFNEDGLIVESWDQWDNLGFVTQLGISAEAMAEAS
jgi:steroid delta-isomerase-like uncharacterized protein